MRSFTKCSMSIVLIIGWALPLCGQSQVLDETWQATVNGQTVQVNPDGSFRIPNVAAADQFGPSGPGSAPDFLSDDFLRVVAVSMNGNGGGTKYAFSESFQITRGVTFKVGELIFTDTPPPFPVSIRFQDSSPLLEVDETSQLTVIGTLEDGSEVDVTARSTLTVYRTSNPAIATVTENGLVTGNTVGPAFITAVNEGATAVKRLTVTQAIQTTTVEGFVQLEDGTPVEAANVTTQFGDATTSDASGFFSFETDVPSEGSLRVRATKTNGQTLTGASGDLEPVPDGITDAGLITLMPGLVRGEIKLLIANSDGAPPVNELNATGFFERIDVFALGTPTADQLSQYDVVLLYTNFTPPNRVLLGDLLADYVDNGGRVVLSTYAFSNPWSVLGRITTTGYSPLINTGSNGSVGTQLVAQSSDVIFDGINLAAVGFFRNSNFARPGLDTGATLLATDNVGNNMIARNAAGNVYGMNLFPRCCNFGGNNAEFYSLVANICSFP